LPGGGQLRGETIFEAAIREVQEETGLTVVPEAVITAVDGIHRDSDGKVRFHYTLIEVEAESLEGDPVAADDVLEVRWVPLSEVESMVEWDITLRVIFQSADRRRDNDQR
jgi:ADP-ribose pyrophosphatase YjhB (NUDIX family)